MMIAAQQKRQRKSYAAQGDLFDAEKICQHTAHCLPDDLLGFEGGLMALNDRLKLRSMVVGEKDDLTFIASEEAAIRAMEPDAENIWSPAGGEPVIIRVKEGAF